jgi:hypothetical protein
VAALAAVYKLVLDTTNKRKRATGLDGGSDDMRMARNTNTADLERPDYR